MEADEDYRPQETRRRRLNDTGSSIISHAKIWPEGIATRNALTVSHADWNPFWSSPSANYDEEYSQDDEDEDDDDDMSNSAALNSESSSSQSSDAIQESLAQPKSEFYCGYRGRKALVFHWEACVQESRDGNTAATDWRESQTFASPFPKAMIELLRFLFAADTQCVPTSIIHRKLLNFMLSRYQSNINRLEKALESEPQTSSQNADAMHIVYSNGLRRLKTICFDLFNICDLASARFMLDQTLGLFSKLGGVMIRNGLHTSQCSILMYSNLSVDNDDARRRNVKLLSSCSRLCRAQHLTHDLTQTIAGWKQYNLSFVQNYVENSRSADVQREYYLLRPDRLLVKLTFIYLKECACRRIEASCKTVQTLSDSTISNLSELVEMVGGCSAMYLMIKWTLMLMIRLSISRDKKCISSVGDLLESLCVNAATRPDPIESIFHSESCAAQRELQSYPSSMKLAVQLLLETFGQSNSLNQVINSMLLCFCVLSKKRGLLDNRALENLPANSFMIAFAETHISYANAPNIGSSNLKTHARAKQSLFTSMSPPKSSPHATSAPAPSTPVPIRQYLLSKLPVTSLTSSDPGDRLLTKFGNQLGLVQFVCGLGSHEFVTAIVQSLLEHHLVEYSASALRSETKQETSMLIQLLIFAVGSSPLVRLTALKAFPAFTCLLACQETLQDLEGGRLATSEEEDVLPPWQATTRRNSISGSSASEKHLSFEKFLECISTHHSILNKAEQPQSQPSPSKPYVSELNALKSLVPQTWLPYLAALGACLNEAESPSDALSPVLLTKEFFSLLQEIFDKTANDHDGADTKRATRVQLTRLHSIFKELHRDQLMATSVDMTSLPSSSLSSVLAARVWRFLLVGLFEYLSRAADQNLLNRNPQCVSILSSFVLMEMRTDRFLHGGADQVPLRILDCIRRAKGTWPEALTEQSLAKNILLEFFLAWISDLCQKGAGHLSFCRSVILRRLWIEIQDNSESILPLKGFEIANFADFVQKRLASTATDEYRVEARASISTQLQFICFGDNRSETSAVSAYTGGTSSTVTDAICLDLVCDPLRTITAPITRV